MPSSPKHLLQRRNMGQINAYVKTKTKIALTARNINNDFPTICKQYFFFANMIVGFSSVPVTRSHSEGYHFRKFINGWICLKKSVKRGYKRTLINNVINVKALIQCIIVMSERRNY